MNKLFNCIICKPYTCIKMLIIGIIIKYALIIAIIIYGTASLSGFFIALITPTIKVNGVIKIVHIPNIVINLNILSTLIPLYVIIFTHCDLSTFILSIL